MNNLSVVIIAKNESEMIGRMLNSLNGVTDDIIVVDSGSEDDTQAIAKSYGAKVLDHPWIGFGINKNRGIHEAKYDWILSLDADELLSEELAANIHSIKLQDENVVYELKFNTYFGNRRLRFGEWGRNEKHVRLFNRKKVIWNNALVHEQLILPGGIIRKTLNGVVRHYTVTDLHEYSKKTTHYAMLNAEKYFNNGKKASWIKLYHGETFSFAWNYVFRLGFLDGYAGYVTAKMTAHYTMLKYARLKELWDGKRSQNI